MGILDGQGQLTLLSVVQSGKKLSSSKILCISLLSGSLKKIGSIVTETFDIILVTLEKIILMLDMYV